jgi:hypothetical protein
MVWPVVQKVAPPPRQCAPGLHLTGHCGRREFSSADAIERRMSPCWAWVRRAFGNLRAPPSGPYRRPCLTGMYIFYLATTAVAALANAYAASLNFVGAESVKLVAEKVRVSQKWMLPFGILLAAGAGGLLVGLAMPVLGAAAAVGLVLYFICALGAHIRVHDRGVGGAISFLVLAAAALASTVAYHNHHHW